MIAWFILAMIILVAVAVVAAWAVMTVREERSGGVEGMRHAGTRRSREHALD